MPERWHPTHRLLAQYVRLLGRRDDQYLVQYRDGSVGWLAGWPHEAVMVPVESVERDALHA